MNTFEKRLTFSEYLQQKELIRVIGAHNSLGAKLGENAGFDAIWLSGFELSASFTLPDANILTMSDTLEAARNISPNVSIPVIVDCDSGFGDVNNVIHMIKMFEAVGVSGVCIEDKIFPKLNSFIEGPQELVDIPSFCEKIIAAKNNRKNPDFLIIARVEALIAGFNLKEALKRAYAYEEAGADAILIHSKKKTPEEIFQFANLYQGRRPLIVVPTTYPSVTQKQLIENKIKVVIYANHGIRAAIYAMNEIYKDILQSGTTALIENRIASLDTIFSLQGMDVFKNNLQVYKDITKELFINLSEVTKYENRDSFTSSHS